jgi:anti-sigma B factor antagonist
MAIRDERFATATDQIGDVLVVSLSGELDMAAAPEVENAIERAQGGSPIIVDLRDLTFIDSTGIRVLLRVYDAGKDGHSSVSFIPGPSSVQRVLEIAGVDRFLTWTSPPAESAVDDRSVNDRAE